MSERRWGLLLLVVAGVIAIPLEFVDDGFAAAIPTILLIGIALWLLGRAGRREDDRFGLLFRDSPVALSISRLDNGLVIEVNAAYAKVFGVGGDFCDHAFRDDAFRRLRAGEEILGAQIEITTASGAKRLMVWSRPVALDGVGCALSTFIDVTEQGRTTENARLANERFEQLAGSIEEVFWLTDPTNETMFYVSPGYEKIFGRRCQDLYENPRDWLAALHPEDVDRMAKASLDMAGGPQQNIYRIIVDGKPRSIQISTFPVRDPSGTVIRIAGVASDLTDQLELGAQLRQTQKLESLGLLAGGIAHDFNNVLAVIGANAGLLTELVPPGHPDREVVDDIEAAVIRATALTRQLLAFSHKQVVEPVVLDVNAAIADTRKMLRRMVGEDIIIETSFEPDLRPTKIDPGHFVQILMNLAVNARDAMPRGGKLAISTRNVEQDIVIEISDTGCGMPADVLSRVFEPFFTTKDVGRGTGLGLSVVHGIVKQAGGTITIESEPDLGTTIQIRLPHSDAPVEPIHDIVGSAAGGTEKIVLVDDDMFVRRSTSRALRARGYSVLEASDASAALRLLDDHGLDIALLITDVVMPGIDGLDLVNTARVKRPSLPVLYMSGYTDDAMLRHGIQYDQVPFIEKPFRSHVIASKVRNVLDHPAPLAR